MALLLTIGTLLLFVWLVARAIRPDSLAVEGTDEHGHELVEALYRDGVKLGYKRAWDHQLAVEEKRVAAYVRRRSAVMGGAAAGGVALASVPMGAALGVLPNQATWLPAWPQWQWLLLAALTVTAGYALGLLLMPRDYRRFAGSRRPTAPEFARLDSEIEQLMEQQAAGRLEAMKSYLSALSNQRYSEGLRQGQSQDSAGIQTKISSAANAAYVQGRADGATEARAEVSQLTTQAYLRGVNDGERTALSKLEGRIRAEREAAYQSGYRVGLTEGRAAAAREAGASQTSRSGSGSRPNPAGARPRTRADALAIFELTENASQEQIRQRYRELQTALHPDGLRGRKSPKSLVAFAEEQFKLVGEAYTILQRGG